MASAPITHQLPEDIVVDILARLPVKSLKRFRCVRKSWCSLIRSPQFISAHYSFSKNRVYPLVKYGKHDDQTEGKNVLSIISNQTLDIVGNLDIPSFTDEERSIYIRGYCNGIICIWYHHSDVLLWNIATKEFKTLPKCPFEFQPNFSNCVDVVCLGYDFKRDDYKVIRIDTFWNDEFEYEDPRSQRGKRIALYNLSTDSWRKLNANLSVVEFPGFYFALSQFYSNGFFRCEASIENEIVLLSFDMSREVFLTTPLPDGSKDSNFHFMEIKGSVGGICHDFCVRNRNSYDVWVLGEVGLKNSWMKLFTVDPTIFNVDITPLGVGSDGKVFFREPRNSFEKFLVWHHPSSQILRLSKFKGIT
ncbi:hypothetical protein DITRI_Ditri16bG0115100 [Diplodiscus trichospermus]